MASTPDRNDFQQAVARRSDRWFAACLAITRSHDLAEDAVQDALLSAWNKREQFQHGSSLDTWIHRIAVNAALALLRKQKPGVFSEYVDEMPAADDASPETERADEELESALRVALGNLSEAERVCFVLKHLEQWRLKEIADELDINIGQVKQALFRGVRKLRPTMQLLRSEAS